jgi:hypothetical protein
MSQFILLDAGPLGLVTNPRGGAEAAQCSAWLSELLRRGAQVRVPEIADYEVRRELFRAGKTPGVRQLDALAVQIGYVPLTTAAMRQAAVFWAQLRQQGQPTAGKDALDGDVILAAQAAILIGMGNTVVIATTNVGHLSRLVPAQRWQEIVDLD